MGRGGKILDDIREVRFANASIRPPSQHDIRDLPVHRHTGERASGSDRGLPAAADPNPRVAAGFNMEAPEMIFEPSHVSVRSISEIS